MSSNYCSHCGAKVPAGAKYCPKCGRAVGGFAAKNKGWLFLLFALLTGLLAAVFFSSPDNGGYSLGVLFAIFSAGFSLASLVKFFRWLLRKNKYVAIGILFFLIVLAGFAAVYIQNWRTYLQQLFEIQDIGTEVAYAKSIGDDLMRGKQVSRAGFSEEKDVFAAYAQGAITSMVHVHDQVDKEYQIIKGKKVRQEFELYRNSVEAWAGEILSAATLNNPEKPTQAEKTRWQKVPAAPGLVEITLENGWRVKALERLADGIKNLKSEGDSAIANTDQFKMRRVVARALIQSNFLESLTATAPDVCSRSGCAAEVKVFLPDVARLAQNYIVGKPSAPKDWQKTWDGAPQIIQAAGTPLGGVGITQGTPDSPPPPNPTITTRDVTPFDQLPPRVAEWDGMYTSQTDITCDAEMQEYFQSFADQVVGNFEVSGNRIVGYDIAIDASGTAHYSADVLGVHMSVNYYFSSQPGGGVDVNGDFSVEAAEDGATASCSGTFSGSRNS